MNMDLYRDGLVNEIKVYASSENMSDRESFFQIYCEKLEQADIIEDFHYLQFKGKGNRNRSIQIDGYVYNELDNKLTIFIIPSLTYYDDKVLTLTETESLFSRAKYFYFDAEKIISSAEESSEGYGLAYDIVNKKITIDVLEIILLTDYSKSSKINVIESTFENSIRVDYSVYDISRMKLLDESENGKEPLVIDLWDEFQAEGIPVLPASKNDEYQAYLCNIPGELLARMYNKYQSRLLEGNVRSFLQTKGKVNKGIRSTILNQPEMFFAFNNGIAATAESINILEGPEGKIITGFKSLQIVNGGQTTASLANAWENDVRLDSRNQIKRIFVPMKVSVVSQKSAEELIPNISRYANSQNKVSDADLASNHPFHRQIEDLSRRIHAPAIDGAQFGKFWYYERANGQYRQETYKSTDSVKKAFESRNPKNQMFKKVDLAKYYNIYLQKPHIASAGSQMSFNKFSEWMIKEWDKNSDFANEQFYRKVISLGILFKKTDTIVKNQDWYDSYKANIVAYTLSLIFYKTERDFPESSVDFQQIWKKQDLSPGWVKQIQKVSYLVYKHLTSKDRLVENVTEWAKRESSWNIAKEIQFDYEEDFIKDLVNKDYVITQDHSAVKEQKKVKEMNALLQVYDYGSLFWKDVYNWGQRSKIWNTQDISLLKLAMGIDEGKVPSDKQSIKILQILEKARSDSFPK